MILCRGVFGKRGLIGQVDIVLEEVMLTRVNMAF